MTIEITHTAADGTVVTGDPRPHHGILKATGFRWSRRIPGWYIPNSRDRAPRTATIEGVAERLRNAGFEVTVDVDDSSRSAAEREADRVERLADRQAGLERKAEKLAAEADTRFAAARQIMDMIPLGQPILVGHHSEGRHRRDLARIDTNMGKGVEAQRASTDAERAAEASRANQAHRESGPATERRIERIEVELRDIDRKLAGQRCKTSGRKMKAEAAGRTFRCPGCFTDVTVGDELVTPEHFHNGHAPASGEWQKRLLARKAGLCDDLAFWQAHLAQLVESGEHVQWRPEMFAKGDRVNDSATVHRVNKKSLTVIHDVWAEQRFVHTLPYDKVRSHQPAKREASA